MRGKCNVNPPPQNISPLVGCADVMCANRGEPSSSLGLRRGMRDFNIWRCQIDGITVSIFWLYVPRKRKKMRKHWNERNVCPYCRRTVQIVILLCVFVTKTTNVSVISIHISCNGASRLLLSKGTDPKTGGFLLREKPKQRQLGDTSSLDLPHPDYLHVNIIKLGRGGWLRGLRTRIIKGLGITYLPVSKHLSKNLYLGPNRTTNKPLAFRFMQNTNHTKKTISR